MNHLLRQHCRTSIVRSLRNPSRLRAVGEHAYLFQDTNHRAREFKVCISSRATTRDTRNTCFEKPVLESSTSSTYIFGIVAVALSTVVFLTWPRTAGQVQEIQVTEESIQENRIGHDAVVPDYAAMPIPQGFFGNLNDEQEARLKEFWIVVLKTFGVPGLDSNVPGSDAPIATQAPATTPAKKEKHGLFHRKNKATAESPGAPGRGNDPEDKYGQASELRSILASTSPQALRDTFWSMVKKDHPDTLVLRFLRARKWDVNKALAMLISTMHWRASEMHLDDDIVKNGEAGALEDSQSSDPTVSKDGKDFLAHLRLGKSFMHGIDKQGRPVCIVRVRLHKNGEHSERSLERYTVYTIETTRLAMQPPVETGTIVFDMTSFTMANMDYAPVKFMIKVFEANYPESLGSVLVHKAPWVFQGVWKIIKGWLDPVVAAKIHFTSNVEELSAYIDKSKIMKELGGDEDWEYRYIEPVPGENDAIKNGSALRAQIEQQRRQEVEMFERATLDWARGADTKNERDTIAQRLQASYWQLDPLIRARSLYDRQGIIGRDGQLNFYPSKASIQPAPVVNGAPPIYEARADDVD